MPERRLRARGTIMRQPRPSAEDGCSEDAAAHVNAASALADNIVCRASRPASFYHHQQQIIELGKSGNLLEVLAGVVGLNNLAAHLSDDAGCKLEEDLRCAHVLPTAQNAAGRML